MTTTAPPAPPEGTAGRSDAQAGGDRIHAAHQQRQRQPFEEQRDGAGQLQPLVIDEAEGGRQGQQNRGQMERTHGRSPKKRYGQKAVQNERLPIRYPGQDKKRFADVMISTTSAQVRRSRRHDELRKLLPNG
ncbi:hypothetical protein [Azospirillum oryzae]|uniref:hypothetical protein n=1 Tax=Azospirillum oryzae TaxID=286727 RepID=UPI001B3BAF6B|nr:hypothetical protein [Azospirillum oryzae]